jgi:hypothetical protein
MMTCLSSQYSTYILPRHCEERLEGLRKAKQVKVSPTGNKRRGNLPSQINWQKVLKTFRKTTLQQTQSREIASRMQQSLALSPLLFPQQRLAMTAKRNEVTKESGWLRLHQFGLVQSFSKLTFGCGSKGLQPLVRLAQMIRGGA